MYVLEYMYLYLFISSLSLFLPLAAHKMYERCVRIVSESDGVPSLEIQRDCVVTVISLLSLMEPKYQWVLKPFDDKSKQFVCCFSLLLLLGCCSVVKLKELKQQHKLITSKLLLIKHKPSLESHLSS